MAQRQLTFASYRVSRTSPSVKRLTKKTGEIYSKKWRTRLEKCTRKRRRRGRAGEQRHIASVKEDREYNRFADNLKNSMRTCKPFDLSASIFASDMRRPLQAADSTLNIVQPQSKDSETSTQKENSIAGGDQDELLNAETNHSNSDEENFPERDDLYFEELHACQNVFDVFRSSFTRQGSTSSHFSPRLLSHPSELLKRNKSSRNKRANFKLPQLLPLDVEVYHNIIDIFNEHSDDHEPGTRRHTTVLGKRFLFSPNDIDGSTVSFPKLDALEKILEFLDKDEAMVIQPLFDISHLKPSILHELMPELRQSNRSDIHV